MKISELIKELQEVQAEHGDVECFSRSKKGEHHGFKHINTWNNADVVQHGCGMPVIRNLYVRNGAKVVTI